MGVRLELRHQGRVDIDIPEQDPRLLQKLAMRWSYTVRNRNRWSGDPHATAGLQHRAGEDLRSLGIGEADIAHIATTRHVQVTIPYEEESKGWEARVFPWEFVLSAAVKNASRTWKTLVTRHLERQTDRRPTGFQGDPKTLVVTSTPGQLSGHYSFEGEVALIRANLANGSEEPDKAGFRHLTDPTVAELQEAISDMRPDLIHLTGMDAYEGHEVLAARHEAYDAERRDGFWLLGEDGQAQVVDATAMGTLINCADTAPSLVVYNVYNSASRLAAMAIAGGAGAAIGFQDEIDDALAETFFDSFYRNWCLTGYDGLANAFGRAFREARRFPAPLRGSGMVLWHSESVIDSPTPKATRSRPEQIRLTQDDDVSQLVTVEFSLPESLNYSMLHNEQPLFTSFRIIKNRSGPMTRVRVLIQLQVGTERFEFRTQIELEGTSTRLEDTIRIPLTWKYVEDLEESVLSAVYVEVSIEGRTAFEDTRTICLQPVQEWIDSGDHRDWLPSFILPRDPQVSSLVRRAQDILSALADSAAVGFDGYQSEERLGFDASGPAVDLQVRAIWAALSFEREIGYINPPPSYAPRSQRLRTPTEIIEDRLGTCIDLTLLLAACLEYVDIFPTIFLVPGHAFCGYWRSHAAWSDFQTACHAPYDLDQLVDGGASQAGRPGSVHGSRNWVLTGPDVHREVLAAVQNELLVPIEATALTLSEGFDSAIGLGHENLEDANSLHTIDVLIARQGSNVTPLPF